MVRKSYTSSLSLTNRGSVIAAINRRPPSNRLSKLLSILKQNAFPRFIVAGSALTFLPLSFIAVRPPPSTPHRDLSLRALLCCHLPWSSTTSSTMTAVLPGTLSSVQVTFRKGERVSSNEISIYEQRQIFPSPKTGGRATSLSRF